MKYRRLGRSGIKIAPIVLGTLNFGMVTEKPEAFSIVESALENGINFIDCANVYGGGESEKILGEIFKELGNRKDIILSSKVYTKVGEGPNDRGTSRLHIMRACEDSLRRLQTDYLDIYFLHRTDFDIPQEETLRAIDDLQHSGKVRHIAVSTHPAWRTVEAIHIADQYGYPKPICEQPPYNILERRIENELIPMCASYDLGIVSWSPLAHGMLAGRYADSNRLPEGSRGTVRSIFNERINSEGVEIGNKLAEYAKMKGIEPAAFAIGWVIGQAQITAAIIGPRTKEHFISSLKALDVEISEEDTAFVNALVPPGRYVSNFFNTSGWMK